MKVFSSDKIREIDAYTIENEPIASIDLMERAAQRCTDWISARFPVKNEIIIICGQGNNGGDGLAIARQLILKGFTIKVCIVSLSSKTSQDFQLNYTRLPERTRNEIIFLKSKDDLPPIGQTSLVIDAIFGSGLSRPIDGIVAGLVEKINLSGARVVSIDTPSGLFSEDNRNNKDESVIRASYTLAFQFPKLAFFFSENNNYIGEWHVLPLGLHPEAIKNIHSDFYYVDHDYAAGLLKVRARFSHKGSYGHGLLIAGSYGMMGAALLASKACLKSGVGLVTAHIPKSGCSILQTAVPESLISLDESDIYFTKVPDLSKYTALAVGPAVGCTAQVHDALLALLNCCALPMVIDADAINILGEHRDWIKHVPAWSILTPHPKEFERLFGKYDNAFERNRAQINFSKKYSLVIVLKGANTSVTCPDGSCWFNSSGNPGMATGGSGDVLTGIILSLLAQNYGPKDAAVLGTYIHGLAGDLASEEESEEGITASDIIKYVGKAFKLLKINSNN